MESDQELKLSIKKTRFWHAVCYIENMVDNWQEDFDAIIQVPYCYCVHDKDLLADGDADKLHVHVMYCFDGPTTKNHAMAVINQFSIDGKVCCPSRNCTPVLNFKRSYGYLIHDTDDARKKGKYQYSANERISGNDFDLGRMDQLSVIEKKDISKEISDLIVIKKFTTMVELYIYLTQNYDDTYYYVFHEQSAYFERLVKGVWQKSAERNEQNDKVIASLKKVLQ